MYPSCRFHHLYIRRGLAPRIIFLFPGLTVVFPWLPSGRKAGSSNLRVYVRISCIGFSKISAAAAFFSTREGPWRFEVRMAWRRCRLSRVAVAFISYHPSPTIACKSGISLSVSAPLWLSRPPEINLPLLAAFAWSFKASTELHAHCPAYARGYNGGSRWASPGRVFLCAGFAPRQQTSEVPVFMRS